MSAASPAAARVRPARRPVIGPRLRVLLAAVAAVLALLGANSAYLVGVRVLDAGFGLGLVNWFVPWMLLAHVALGLLVTAPLVAFGALHWKTARHRKNRRAVKVGYALFAAAIGLIVTGFLLLRVDGLPDLAHPAGRAVVYGLHVGLPLACGWLYWLHRLAGRRINWKLGGYYAGATAGLVAAMCAAHSLDPRTWNAVSPESGAAYFEPSLARTEGGTFIPAAQLMTDDSCAECHPDSHAAHRVSAHSFSSFNNPLYLAAVRATREKVNDRDGSVQAARWCAGCHDPVPFFSGRFDDPNYDDVNDPTAGASITCTVCHGVTEIGAHGGVRGNADYVLSAPEPYPFEGSENAVLKWVNRQLVKAKPAVHKKDMLKPLHKSEQFCATCHKVGLPEELNGYKWLRGQNHYDSASRFPASPAAGRAAFITRRSRRRTATAATCPATPPPTSGPRRERCRTGAGATTPRSSVFTTTPSAGRTPPRRGCGGTTTPAKLTRISCRTVSAWTCSACGPAAGSTANSPPRCGPPCPN